MKSMVEGSRIKIAFPIQIPSQLIHFFTPWGVESQLNEALHSTEARSTSGLEGPGVLSSKATGDGIDSSAVTVTKKLEEELKKRDALIEVIALKYGEDWGHWSMKRVHSTHGCNLWMSTRSDWDRFVDHVHIQVINTNMKGAHDLGMSGSLELSMIGNWNRLIHYLIFCTPISQVLRGSTIADLSKKSIWCSMAPKRVAFFVWTTTWVTCDNRLHEENEKLFDRLTEKASMPGSAQVSSPLSRGQVNVQPREQGRVDNNSLNKGRSMDVIPSQSATDKTDGTVALVKSGSEKAKTTPAGEYLTAALNDFDPEQYDSLAAISDGANKLLMLVLAAVIKAGASREHEILAEIRDAVFSFIRKMEPKRVMDTMLVSRVRILYIRSLLARSPELQSIKVSPVECFLEKGNIGRSRSSSRGNSPGRSPVCHADEQIHGFKDSWRQQVTGGKLREIQEEAKSFAIGNKALAALFVHTPAGELQRQIRSWLAENFDFLSVTGDDASGGTTGQLELLSTAIMDGWMAGLGAALPPSTDALGQLLFEYAKRVYTSQLQHLKDIAGTLATEEAADAAQVAKLRSALESVDHKRRKLLQQMRGDIALLTLEDGGSPIQNPSTAAEDARLASLISLDGILKQIKDIMRQSSVSTLSKSKKKAMLASLDELLEQMPSLLDIDHPCAQRQIADARRVIEICILVDALLADLARIGVGDWEKNLEKSIPEEDDHLQETSYTRKASADLGSGSEVDVAQWNVLQFNTGSTTPFIIKCGANSNSELVIKADARVQEPKGGEIVRVVPRPSVLENMSLEEIKQVFSQLPEALSLLSLARTADGTRARYSRLYRTLAMKVPSLRDLVGELEKGGVLKDVRS
uniref:Reverse transcriptase zinc-binding domain-containing protein n=1 Tax=Fagus sylvatica TaxID=28930 RepID=A0A2N9IYY4_FAGSY